MATVIIPTPLRKFTNNTARLSVKGSNVEQIVSELSLNFPDLKKHLVDETGSLRSFVNVFVGDDDIRNLQQGQTAVQDDTVISIVPAIAGGVDRKEATIFMARNVSSVGLNTSAPA